MRFESVIPQSWKLNTIGEKCHIHGGNPAPQVDEAFTADGIPFVRMKDLGAYHLTTNLTEVTDQISPAYAKANRMKVLPKGAILMPRSGSVALNHRAILGVDAIIVSHICGLEITDELIDPKFLYYLLSTIKMDRITKKTTGLDALTFLDLAKVEFPLPYKNGRPDLAEQRRIAAILDKADALRRKAQQALDLTDDLIRSTFLDMFGDPVTNPKGWPEATIEEVAVVQGGLQLTSTRSKYSDVRPYLRVANVYRDRLDLTEIKTMGVSESEALRALLQAGDILVVEGHGNPNEIGRCAVWTGEIEGCIHQNHLIRVRCGNKVRPSYLSAFLNSDGGKRQMFAHGKTTSGLNTISTRNVKSVRVLLPPITLQDRFRDLRAKAMDAHTKREAQFQRADDLFACALQRAFAGGL